MTLSVKNAGAWSAIKDLYINKSGVWLPVKQGFVKNSGTWVEYYAAEVVITISANSNNVDLSSIFNRDDWLSSKKKRVVVQSGVIVGSDNPNIPAMHTGASWNGELILDNRGTIQGAGGSINSGIGGNALHADTAGLIVNNIGIIRSGGGGGGRGGAGGSGYGTTTTPPSYDKDNRWWLDIWFKSTYTGLMYAGTIVHWDGYTKQGTHTVPGEGSNVFNADGQKFTRGAFIREEIHPNGPDAETQYDYWSIGRTVSAHTSGGAGGNGGRGAGNDGAAAPGAAGLPGGINAGQGGAGGAGGTYGEAGAEGSHGEAGSNGSGSPGVSGGPAGVAYNSANITMNNTGTIVGRTQ